MISVTFKNVGQGDSILIEWKAGDATQYGIVDCNLYNNSNPLLEEIKRRKIDKIEFMILSHFHLDHYSGYSELLEYCMSSSIKIGRFYHTFRQEYYKILTAQFNSQKIQRSVATFWTTYQKAVNSIIDDYGSVTHNVQPIILKENVELRFLSPNERDYDKLTKQQAKYDSDKSTTPPDFNSVSTVIKISNSKNSILLTGDATRTSFQRLKGKMLKEALLVQVPHHGSDKNHEEPFWKDLKYKENCPAIYSVGYVKRDSIPKRNVVEFFDKNKFYNASTNFVFGLSEYYGAPILPLANSKTLLLNIRSRLRNVIETNPAPINVRFFGDKRLETPL